jgi:hypothetical protein
MPITKSSSSNYDFVSDYDSLPKRSVPIIIRNYSNDFITNTLKLSCFSNTLDSLTFNPDFTNVDHDIDDSVYYLDFGDGTITSDLTATHVFKNPGDYKVTLVVADSAFNLYKSTFQPTIRVRDLIPNKIFLTYNQANSGFSSTLSNGFVIYRFNSYQNYNTLSAGGYTINLKVSGNKAKYYTNKEYYADPYVHLKTFSAFISSNQTSDYEVVDSVLTTNEKIYAKRNPGVIGGFDLFNKQVDGSVFVGTSGQAEVFYYEDF